MKKFALIIGACLALVPGLASATEGSSDSAPSASKAEGPQGEGNWYDNLHGQVMASGFYMLNTGTVSGPYNSIGYPYTQQHGFGLNFAGADVNYDGKYWGVTMNLRFGPGAGLLTPIAPVKQAFATWKPMSKLTIDLGFFDTIYGAEVADEWQNLNFTRGALYFLRQPFNHMGLRISAQVTDLLGLNFILANGNVGITGVGTIASGGLGGQASDADQVPSFGLQLTLAPSDSIFVAVGYMTGTNGTEENKRFAHFIDVVGNFTFGGLSLVLNADFTIDPEHSPGADLALVYGVSLGIGYQFNQYWKLGLRGEYLGGNEASGEIDLFATATLSIRYSPIEFLTITVEPRAEFADDDAVASRRLFNNGTASTYFGVIVGATAHWGR